MDAYSTKLISSTFYQEGVRKYGNTKSPFKHKNVHSKDKGYFENSLSPDRIHGKANDQSSKAAARSSLVSQSQEKKRRREDPDDNNYSNIILRQSKERSAKNSSLLLLQMQNNKIVVLPQGNGSQNKKNLAEKLNNQVTGPKEKKEEL